MTKKFDVVVGNPPYQEETEGGGRFATPVYNLFMDAAYEVAEKAVLITPARFLFNAGQTPKAWNAKMLADPHLSVPHYVPNSDDLFPGTEIMGGVAVTYRDESREGEPIGVFSMFAELNAIHHKVVEAPHESIASLEFTSSRSYRYTERMHEENPEVEAQLPNSERYKLVTSAFTLPVFHAERPDDGREYARMYGLADTKRVYRWVRRDYIEGPESLDKYKVAVPASRNAGGMLGNKPALVTGYSLLLEPGVGVTQTFISIGSFDTRAEGEACLKYIQSKFARVILGILKVTQHNPRSTWKYVPKQDFTSASDIDWTKSLPEIDAQLYAKYGLDPEEIAFIDAHVKPMD
ncbi:Eco57I restriction-modification methylase domain-containing protein [Aeromicrobium sp. Root472D3]|uniref:Eco57I restriction-modification methylase domain-containing protein n=1 Tax=Aeromicrobium sp. Root472D3 TaxID=1736540 RepID=UPI0006FC2EB1|nr:Eco57I restriction-modification methylase domain-containing protein [Aeromicrobium sp. Root472D3]KQX72387.1 restriction endonuclease [Aeromicrobium sp. Root472D3]